MKKLAIVTTHPIQYHAPLFRMLQQRRKIYIKVFYTWGEAVLQKKYDPGFDEVIEWDIPLLEGYAYTFAKNISRNAGSHHFRGIENPDLVREIEEWDADAILVYGWSFKSHLKVIRYFKGKKNILFRGDSTLLNESKGLSLKKIIRKLFLTWVYSHVDTALFVGNRNKDYYIKFGLKKNQLVFAPHAIDNDRYNKAVTTTLREQLLIPPSDIVFLFAGKFESEKNPVLLLDAFIMAALENVHLLMVGNGQLKNTLESKVKTQHWNLQQRIHFIEFQNQSKMPQVYQAADVFVLASQSETWGLSVNEAMASGNAVLISNKCGCSQELVENGINGFIFQSNDIYHLAEKMKKLVANKKTLADMGKESRKIIQKWSYPNVCMAIETAIQKL